MATKRAMIDPGKMNERIEIRRADSFQNDDGDIEKSPDGVSYGFAWAEVQEEKAERIKDGAVVQSQCDTVFVVRYRKDLKETDLIVWDEAIYNELRFRMLDNRSRLEIRARRRGPRNEQR